MRTVFLFGVLVLCACTDSFAQSRHRQIPTQAASAVPTVSTQTTKVLKSPTWDYMTWTDASETKHLRAKLVSADEATVHLAKVDGATVSVPVSSFSKEDQSLISQYAAKDTAIVPTDADHDELIKAIKTAMTIPNDTSIRREAESEKRQAAFLKQYNGKPFVLCFPIYDIRQERSPGTKLPDGQYSRYLTRKPYTRSHLSGLGICVSRIGLFLVVVYVVRLYV